MFLINAAYLDGQFRLVKGDLEIDGGNALVQLIEASAGINLESS